MSDPTPLHSDRSAWDINFENEHASDINDGVFKRHLPSGSAAGQTPVSTGSGTWSTQAIVTLASLTPAVISALAGSAGSSGSAARADHAHFHGNLSGGSLHGLATASENGFLRKLSGDAADFLTGTGIWAKLTDFTNISVDGAELGAGSEGVIAMKPGVQPASAPVGTIQIFATGSGATSGSVSAVPVMTTNINPSGSASCSSHYATVDAWSAFGSGQNGWISDTGAVLPQYIGYKFDTAKIITKYSILAWWVDNYPSRTPKTWTFEGSNDGSSWDTLNTQTDYTDWSNVTYKEFDVTSPGSYTYYRLYITANQGNAYTGIGGLKLFEGIPATDIGLAVMSNGSVIHSLTDQSGSASDGWLSSTDWNIFNSKGGTVSGSGTNGQIAVWDTSGSNLNGVPLADIDHNSLDNLTTGDPHTQYVKKAGDTMTGNLVMDTASITGIDTAEFNLLYTTSGSEAVGSLFWNPVDGTLNIKLLNNATLQTGQELHFYGKCSGGIDNGDVVQFAGVQGDHILIKKAVGAELMLYPHYLVGVATQPIANGDYGYVTWFGKVNGVYTTGWTVGDLLYVDNSTGQLTNIEPTVPERKIIVAALIKEATGASENGIIIVRPTFGMRLTDLDDVDETGLATGTFLTWSSSGSKFTATSNISGSSSYSGSSGSSLGGYANNADTVDGLHAADFMPVGSGSNYVPYIGATGNVDIGDNTYLGNSETFIDADRNGFLNQTETTLAFDGTSEFTLGDAGSGWSYYNAGIKHHITGDKTVDLLDVEDPLVDGRFYYIYITGTSGDLTASIDPWNLVDDGRIPVATIFWNNAATPKYWMAEERHTVLIDRRFHAEHHFTEGSEIATFPTLSEYIVEPSDGYDTDDGKTFAISTAVMYDEDIRLALTPLADPNGTDADYMVFYRTDADSWTWKASAMPYPYNTGTNLIQWDNAGTLTDGTEGLGSSQRYYNSYLIVTNISGAARWMIIPGQHEYTSLAAAIDETPGILTLTGLPVAESVFAYQLTWHTKNFTSKGHAVLASAPKELNIATLSIAGTVTEHNTLSGLQGGTGGEYYHLTAQQLGSMILGFGSVNQIPYFSSGSTLTSGSNFRITGGSSLDLFGNISLDGVVSLNRPAGMTGTLIVGDGGSGISHTGTTEGYYNTFVGSGAGLSNTTGYYNTLVGRNAGNSITTAYDNTAFGFEALYTNGSGTNNTAIGMQALRSATGTQNVALGMRALYGITSGGYNVGIGYAAGRFLSDDSTPNQTSTYSFYLGYNTHPSADGNTNEYVIGTNLTGLGSNTIIIGNSSITKTVLAGKVGIGTNMPGEKLHIAYTANDGTDGLKLGTGGTSSGYLFADDSLVLDVDHDNNATEKYFGVTTNGYATELFRVQDNGNIGINTSSAFGSGVKVIGISNATTPPSGAISGGGVLYASAGELKWLNSSGEIASLSDTSTIRRSFATTVVDNTATTVFKITTANETGSTDGGGYSVFVHALISHGASSGTGDGAVKSFTAQFCRVMKGIGTGVNSAVSEVVETASAATTAATRDIGTVTMTLLENTEYINEVQFTVDGTGTSITGMTVIVEVQLIWYGFLRAPILSY